MKACMDMIKDCHITYTYQLLDHLLILYQLLLSSLDDMKKLKMDVQMIVSRI